MKKHIMLARMITFIEIIFNIDAFDNALAFVKKTSYLTQEIKYGVAKEDVFNNIVALKFKANHNVILNKDFAESFFDKKSWNRIYESILVGGQTVAKHKT